MNMSLVKYVGPLSLAFLLSSCADRPLPIEISGVLDVDKNCNDVLRMTTTQGENVTVRDYKMGRNEGCEDFWAFAELVNLEMNDPGMAATKSAAALDLVMDDNPVIRDAVLKALGRYNISEQNLRERVEFDAAMKHIKGIPGAQCTSDIGYTYRGINFCEKKEEAPGKPENYNPLMDVHDVLGVE